MIGIIIIFPNPISKLFLPNCLNEVLNHMIQRIQTVYLFLVFLLSVSIYFLPISSKIGIDGNSVLYKADAFKIFQVNNGEVTVVADVIFNTLINGAIGLLALFAIFKFKSRGLQLKVCNVLMMFCLVFVALLFYETDRMIPGSNADFRTIYLPGIYAACLMPLLIFMAQRAIKKDDDLVRSVDRIR